MGPEVSVDEWGGKKPLICAAVGAFRPPTDRRGTNDEFNILWAPTPPLRVETMLFAFKKSAKFPSHIFLTKNPTARPWEGR